MEQQIDWAVVEVAGRIFGGRVRQQEVAGRTFLRIEVPETPAYVRRVVGYGPSGHWGKWDHKKPARPAFVTLLAAASINSITPCSEATARIAAKAGAPAEMITLAEDENNDNPVFNGHPGSVFDEGII